MGELIEKLCQREPMPNSRAPVLPEKKGARAFSARQECARGKVGSVDNCILFSGLPESAVDGVVAPFLSCLQWKLLTSQPKCHVTRDPKKTLDHDIKSLLIFIPAVIETHIFAVP